MTDPQTTALTVIKKIAFGFYIALMCLNVAGASFMLYVRHADAALKAEIYTTVDDHSPMNHGQKSIEITLPKGMSFASFGGCGPHWQSPDPEKVEPVWQSITCNVEKWDDKFQGDRPAPYQGGQWVAIKDVE